MRRCGVAGRHDRQKHPHRARGRRRDAGGGGPAGRGGVVAPVEGAGPARLPHAPHRGGAGPAGQWFLRPDRPHRADLGRGTALHRVPYPRPAHPQSGRGRGGGLSRRCGPAQPARAGSGCDRADRHRGRRRAHSPRARCRRELRHRTPVGRRRGGGVRGRVLGGPARDHPTAHVETRRRPAAQLPVRSADPARPGHHRRSKARPGVAGAGCGYRAAPRFGRAGRRGRPGARGRGITDQAERRFPVSAGRRADQRARAIRRLAIGGPDPAVATARAAGRSDHGLRRHSAGDTQRRWPGGVGGFRDRGGQRPTHCARHLLRTARAAPDRAARPGGPGRASDRYRDAVGAVGHRRAAGAGDSGQRVPGGDGAGFRRRPERRGRGGFDRPGGFGIRSLLAGVAGTGPQMGGAQHRARTSGRGSRADRCTFRTGAWTGSNCAAWTAP